MIQEFLLSLSFLTRLPVAKNRDFGSMTLARSAWAFPLAGALIGALASLVYANMLGFGHSIAAWLTLAFWVWFTGGLHEDGLADMADGLAHGRDREQKLAIMRDSRIGSYGVLALVIALALRAETMAGFTAMQSLWAFMAAGAGSRAVMVLLMHTPPARPDGLAASAGQPSSTQTSVALLIAGFFLLFSGTSNALLLGAIAMAATYFFIDRLARQQFGGITGDVLGAAQQIAEIALLILLLP